jgi:hypothetical protein
VKGLLQGLLRPRIKKRIESGIGRTGIEIGKRKEKRNVKDLIKDQHSIQRKVLATNRLCSLAKKSTTFQNLFQSLISQTVKDALPVTVSYQKM